MAEKPPLIHMTSFSRLFTRWTRPSPHANPEGASEHVIALHEHCRLTRDHVLALFQHSRAPMLAVVDSLNADKGLDMLYDYAKPEGSGSPRASYSPHFSGTPEGHDVLHRAVVLSRLTPGGEGLRVDRESIAAASRALRTIWAEPRGRTLPLTGPLMEAIEVESEGYVRMCLTSSFWLSTEAEPFNPRTWPRLQGKQAPERHLFKGRCWASCHATTWAAPSRT